MGYQLPEKIRNIKPYIPSEGACRVRLDANESFLVLPEAIRAEVAKAVSEIEFNRYPDPAAGKLCRKAAAVYGVSADSLVAGNGSDELIGLIIGSFLSPNDQMVVAVPDFSMYAFYAQMNGAKVCDARTVCAEKVRDTFALSADLLVEAVRKTKAKLLIFSNPCNPTSLRLSAAEVRKIAESLPDVLVVVDEAYMEFAGGESMLQAAADSDHVIVLKTCSKAFGMAGIRLGFAVSGPLLSGVLRAVKSPYNVNSMTQAAGGVLFSHPEYLKECTEAICRSRDVLYRKLRDLKEQKKEILSIQPTETNFVFLRTARPKEIWEELEKRGILIRLMGDYLRISAGS